MAEQDDEVQVLAVESARRVLARHPEAPWLQLFVRVAYAYEEMTGRVQPAHSRAFFAQSNPEVVVRLLTAWLESRPDLSSPGISAALAELRARLESTAAAAPSAAAEAIAPPMSAQDTAEMLADALTSAELADRMQVTRQAINQRRTRGQLLGFRRGREYLYPRWQLGEDGVPFAGLAPVLEALGEGTPEAHARFLLSPHPGLGSDTPISRIRAGRTAEVLAAITAS